MASVESLLDGDTDVSSNTEVARSRPRSTIVTQNRKKGPEAGLVNDRPQSDGTMDDAKPPTLPPKKVQICISHLTRKRLFLL